MIDILCTINELNASGGKTGGHIKVMSTGSEDYVVVEVVDVNGQFASVKINPRDLSLATEHAKRCFSED